MAFVSNNTAYDISLFEAEAPARELPYRKPKRAPKRTSRKSGSKSRTKSKSKAKIVTVPQRKIEQIRRRKHNPFKLAVGFAFSAVIIVVISAIICGQVQLTELNQKIANAKDDLENMQSQYTQMKMNVDAKYTTAIVEEYAQNNLGMTKASNSQKEFVDLSDGDKAEITENSETGLFEKIADALSSLWS